LGYSCVLGRMPPPPYVDKEKIKRADFSAPSHFTRD
jgi:hypothetical protein